MRTVWWVRGVGPVKIFFRHTGGEIGQATLLSHEPDGAPGALRRQLLPLDQGRRPRRFRWRNSKHMKQLVDAAGHGRRRSSTTRRASTSRASPGRSSVAGSYVFSTPPERRRRTSRRTKARDARARSRRSGPRSAPADKRRHFFTPYRPHGLRLQPGARAPTRPRGSRGAARRSAATARSSASPASTRCSARQTVSDPGRALHARSAVRSTLRQKGFRFGSGTRTSWFAPGKGLVKLVFRHRDGSVSTVERLK